MAGLVGLSPEHLGSVDPLRRMLAKWPDGVPIIKPMYHTPVLFPGASGVEARDARFGISRQFSSFNARSEALTESRLWKSLFGKHHAVAPLSYIVEWRAEGAARVPYLISRSDGGPLMTPALFAPCFDDRRDTGFAICTRAPNRFFAHFHDRMVGVLTAELMERWLHPEDSTPSKLLECVRAPDEDELVARRAKGELMKRKAEDTSPIETTGNVLTIADIEGPAATKGTKQSRLGG